MSSQMMNAHADEMDRHSYHPSFQVPKIRDMLPVLAVLLKAAL